MNKKCFCCFESINNNLDSENDLMTHWLDFRSEELETNLSEEDKRHLLKFDVLLIGFWMLLWILKRIMFLMF